MRRYIILSILVIVLILSIFFILRKPELNELFPEYVDLKDSEWFGIYLKNNKVGYNVSNIDTLKDGYVVRSFTYMKINPVSGMEKDVSYEITANTDTLQNLKNFTFRMNSEKYRFYAEGRKEGKKLIIEYTSGKQKNRIEKELSIDEIPATLEAIVSTGRTGEFEYFDPTTQSLMKIKIDYKGEDYYNGIRVKKYSVSMVGIEIDFLLDEEGKLLKEESPIGLTLLKEDKKNAMKIEGIQEGLYDSYSIKTNTIIRNPRDVKRLKVRIKDVDLSGLKIIDSRQKIKKDILEIKKTFPMNNFTIPDSIKKFTLPEEFIPSDAEIIIKKAKEITGNLEGWEKVQSINRWVFENLKKKPSFTIPDPIEVLSSLEGDCNEHSALFVALARASGIPAKVEVGIVYFGDAFYYHAWASVWFGQWVSVDPTFGQEIADATHIKLEEGGFENQVKLYKVINKLKIEILEYD
uniref:Transglutaminase domain-containing protein n=1 Tax=candidate division WOR-3 bacterium TaxID=2052148 RepID=A0A7C4UD71_UNCW3